MIQQCTGGSNPSLSAISENRIRAFDMEKYPRGRRGSPAKGVVCESAARVQIPASPPENLLAFDTKLVDYFFAFKALDARDYRERFAR